MQFFRLIHRSAAFAFVVALLSTPALAHAGASPATLFMAPVLAKAWFLGYALVFLAILLGFLAVTIPSMRKTLRKKER